MNILKRLLVSFLLVTTLLDYEGFGVAYATVLSGDVRLDVAAQPLDKEITLTGSDKKVQLSFQDVAVSDVLRALAKKGGFNVLVDESVKASISVDLKNVTIRDALEAVKTYANLAYSTNGTTLIAADASSDRGKAFQRTHSKVFTLRYANASAIANMLNSAVFSKIKDSSNSSGGSGGSSSSASGAPQVVTADSRTNSLIVVGSKSDVQTVKEYLEVLDIPREMKTWRLNQANALDVAMMLSSSILNDGFAGLSSGNSSGGSSTGPGNQASPLRVRSESIQDGEGNNNKKGESASLGQGGGGGSGGGGSGGSSGGSSSGGGSSGSSSPVTPELTLRGSVKKDEIVNISPQGALIVPDTRLNTITLLGTLEQIEQVDRLMPILDKKLPQVAIEVSVIELSELQQKDLGFSAAANSGTVSFGTNNTQYPSIAFLDTPFSRNIGLPTSITSAEEALFRVNGNPLVRTANLNYQLNALISNKRGKVLSNPTVVTAHDKEAVISIVDEVIKTTKLTVDGSDSSSALGTEVTFGEAGIVLDILPKIGANGLISMRVRPTVTTVREVTEDRFGNSITLLSKREILAQNIVMHQGESFVLGGLVQNTDTNALKKLPYLSDLPIVGALLRSSSRAKNRSELVVIITPHLLDEPMAYGQNSEPLEAPLTSPLAAPLNPATYGKEISVQPSVQSRRASTDAGTGSFVPAASTQPPNKAPTVRVNGAQSMDTMDKDVQAIIQRFLGKEP